MEQPARRPLANPPQLPPHSIEAEQGILGCVLIDPLETMGTFVERFQSKVEVMYDLRHQDILRTMLAMYNGLKPIDAITLQNELNAKRKLDSIGGLTYLASLEDVAMSTGNLPVYLDIVRDKYLRRQLLQSAAALSTRAYNETTKADEIMDDAEQTMLAIRSGLESGDDEFLDMAKVGLALKSDMEAQWRGEGVTGLRTGFTELDKKIEGLMPQQFIVLAGMESTGKTSLAMNIVDHVISYQDAMVGLFSLETSAKTLLHRMVCARSQLNGRWIKERENPDMLERGRFMETLAEVMQSKQIIACSKSGLTIQQIRSKARRMHRQAKKFYRPDEQVKLLLVIDYLQLIHGDGENATERASNISRGIKEMANELGCPIIAISSLSNDGQIRSSGQIRYDADQVWKLSCEDPHRKVRKVVLNVSKSKDTDIGKITLAMYPEQFRFGNYVDDED